MRKTTGTEPTKVIERCGEYVLNHTDEFFCIVDSRSFCSV
jgi:hypothetical protein